MPELQDSIEDIWAGRETIEALDPDQRRCVDAVMAGLDSGRFSIVEFDSRSRPQLYEWLKKAVLLYLRYTQAGTIECGPGRAVWYDKVAMKCASWQDHDFAQAGFRLVPGAIVRYGAYIAPRCVVMPSFINIGSFVNEGTMVDSWATVGSCAQIGRNCHISNGAGIGGVLEPLQAAPVIIEDNVFIGAQSEIAEGMHIGEGAVIGMGVQLGASVRIIDRITGDTYRGHVPPGSVVVPGSQPGPDGGPNTYCAVIVKHVDDKTRAGTSVNELLRH